MATFALFLLFFSIELKDERDSAFSLDTFSDKTFVITTSGSFVLLILSTVLSIFQTVLKTVTLDVRQWLICTAVALPIVVAAEIRKAVLRQTAAKAIPRPAPGPEPPPAERPSRCLTGPSTRRRGRRRRPQAAIKACSDPPASHDSSANNALILGGSLAFQKSGYVW